MTEYYHTDEFRSRVTARLRGLLRGLAVAFGWSDEDLNDLCRDQYGCGLDLLRQTELQRLYWDLTSFAAFFRWREERRSGTKQPWVRMWNQTATVSPDVTPPGARRQKLDH